MTKVFGLACLFAAAAATAHAATLTVSAGLGGVAKTGRWTPVFVSIASDGERFDGELHVSWGDTRLRRPVTLAAGANRDFELYLRTTDARATVAVQLVSNGRAITTVNAPVRVLGFDDAVVLCVRADAAAADAADCTTSVLARDLPHSMRAYEVVDRVTWSGGTPSLSAEQDVALRAWSSIEALDASGDLGLTPQVSRPQVSRGLAAGVRAPLGPVAAVYLLVLIATAAALRARRTGLAASAAALTLLVAAACVAVAGIGRVGSSRAVHLHHVSLLQQLPGTDVSVLSMRGLAEFPAFDAFALRLPTLDAAIETTTPRGGVEGELDTDGFPAVRGVFGAGGRQSFGGEAIVPVQLLAVSVRGGDVEFENRSSHTLRDCRAGAGLTPPAVDRLGPGERLSASWTEGTDGAGGPLLTCVTDGAVLPLTEAGRPVIMSGVTTVAVYRDGAAGAGGD